MSCPRLRKDSIAKRMCGKTINSDSHRNKGMAGRTIAQGTLNFLLRAVVIDSCAVILSPPN
jgi:hypothetical protein